MNGAKPLVIHSGGPSLMQLKGQMGAQGCHWGDKSSKDGLICSLLLMT